MDNKIINDTFNYDYSYEYEIIELLLNINDNDNDNYRKIVNNTKNYYKFNKCNNSNNNDKYFDYLYLIDLTKDFYIK